MSGNNIYEKVLSKYVDKLILDTNNVNPVLYSIYQTFKSLLVLNSDYFKIFSDLSYFGFSLLINFALHVTASLQNYTRDSCKLKWFLNYIHVMM